MNPVQARGQIEGGVAQGLGLALLEELVRIDGKIANANFTDYLLPTAMDTPPIEIAAFIEQLEPGAPFGASGDRLSSRPLQLLSPIRDATGFELNQVPIKPEDLALNGL